MVLVNVVMLSQYYKSNYKVNDVTSFQDGVRTIVFKCSRYLQSSVGPLISLFESQVSSKKNL